MVIRHSSKLYKFIVGTNFKIIVLTSFHKNFLISCGLQKENIYVIPNLFHLQIMVKKYLSSNLSGASQRKRIN